MLPAYAGMIRGYAQNRSARGRAPRVCGDDPTNKTRLGDLSRVLPAYAGMIRS